MSFCRKLSPWLLIVAVLLNFLTACTLPQVSAEDRLFLDLSLDFLGEYRLPKMTFDNTPVGGLSAIAYDRQRDRFYALSDDRSQQAPARFYTLRLTLNSNDSPNDSEPGTVSPGVISIDKVEVEGVTLLKGENGETYVSGTINPEGFALSPRQTVFVSSEGVTGDQVPPFIGEFDLRTGQWQQYLPIPDRYLPATDENGQLQGIPDNLGFESLTLNPVGSSSGMVEPFRLFTATESALWQDIDTSDQQSSEASSQQSKEVKGRFLHYLIGEDLPVLISEHLYPVSLGPQWSVTNGLTEMLAIDQGGHFLGLERSLGFQGFGAKIFQLASGGATDISNISSLKGDVTGINPIQKRNLLDLSTLNITLDNLEGMTMGPRLPDGTQSLLLVSDDNFNEAQVTQFLLFRLNHSH